MKGYYQYPEYSQTSNNNWPYVEAKDYTNW